MATAALAGALLCGAALGIADVMQVFAPVVPWSVPILLVMLAIATFIYARTIPKRLEQRQLPAREAVRAVVMAKSLIATGALLAGAHAVYVGRFLPAMAAELPAARVWVGVATIAAAMLCAWAGWVLERACMIDHSDSNGPDNEGSPAAA